MIWTTESVNDLIESINELIIKFKISFPNLYISTISLFQIVKMKLHA
jgi:hypothetical protein